MLGAFAVTAVVRMNGMKPLRVGIVGCGVIGPTHAESYLSLDDVELAWACDLQEARAAKLADRFGAGGVTTSAAEVFADSTVQAVSLCTDHASHAELAAAALAAGKHVLCEKALGPSTDALDAMVAAARAHPGQVFSGVFQHRFNGLYRRLKQLIADGAFGAILTADVRMHCYRSNAYYEADAWRGTWAGEGGSVLINQAIHMIDILAWMLGGVEEVCAAYDNLTHGPAIETEDTAAAVLRFSSRALGTIRATASSHLGWHPVVSISGVDGVIEIRDGRVQMLDLRDKAGEAALRDELEQADRPVVAPTGKSYYGGHHQLQIADFVEAIRQQRAPFVTAESARHAVDIVLGIYQSHRTRGWVSLPAPAVVAG